MPTTRQAVYDALTREDDYAKAWSKGKQSKVEGVEDHMVSRKHGHPFSMADWFDFHDLYIDEARYGYANYVPDEKPLLIRALKAASMLIAYLQTNATEADLQAIAGKSRTEFPVNTGGLKQFKQKSTWEGEDKV